MQVALLLMACFPQPADGALRNADAEYSVMSEPRSGSLRKIELPVNCSDEIR